MKSRTVPWIALALVLLLQQPASAESIDDLIFPDPNRTIAIVAADSCGSELPCGEVLTEEDPLAQLILDEIRLPFHQSLVKVSQCLRNLVGDTAGPNVLYASSNEGGYARQGLAIAEPGGVREYPNLRYVDLVLDPERIAQGELDIYSHELGHVMMGLVWPDRWGGWSPKQHVSMGITDNYVALSEGWGIHFQQLAMDHVKRYRENLTANQHHSKGIRWLWHSHLDTRLRLESVKYNDYIHRKLLPSVDTAGMSVTDLIFLEHTSPHFDRCNLRSAQEMMAAEGIIATLFYRITTDSVLQHNYQDLQFYQSFLLHAGPEGTRPDELFTPLENVLLKTASVWQSVQPTVDSTSAPFLAIINSWCEQFPDDREELLTLFLSTTVAKTVTVEVGEIYERAAYLGMVGKYMEYRAARDEYQTALEKVISDVLAGRRAIDENLGPQLWVENPDLEIPITIFFPEPVYPLWINLNTAGLFDLISFTGVSVPDAERILSTRDSLGYFESLEQASVAGFKP